MEENEAEQRLDAGPLLPRAEKPKRKARRPWPHSLESSLLLYFAQAKKARKARVPADEEAEEAVREVELPSAEDDGAGIGDDPLEARSREDTLSMGELTCSVPSPGRHPAEEETGRSHVRLSALTRDSVFVRVPRIAGAEENEPPHRALAGLLRVSSPLTLARQRRIAFSTGPQLPRRESILHLTADPPR